MKKLIVILLAALLLFAFAGCDRLVMYEDDMIKSVTVSGTGGAVCEIHPKDCEELATLLLKEADFDGRGQSVESNYASYLSVEMVVGRLTYTFYIHPEGTMVRTTTEVGDKFVEIYDTKLAEVVLELIKDLTT